jgi:tRNA-dihydrouridine synthase B
MSNAGRIAALLGAFPVVLAPMEDVSDAVYRRICRDVGANICVTEFIGAEALLGSTRKAQRKLKLAADDRPTAIQIYGPDPDALVAAARVVETAAPSFIDINCGCWVPRVVGRGAGAAWLRDPAAMVEMARRIIEVVELPVTVKTRIGWGPESHMPIVDLARRLEDVGVAALTIHCRTAQMGHRGDADWSWARRAREVVSIPVIVNGDVRTAADVPRALAETGCAGVMIGRAAIEHPWIFREARAALAGTVPTPPTDAERIAMYRTIMLANVAERGEKRAVPTTRRHVSLLGPLVPEMKAGLYRATTIAEALAVLHRTAEPGEVDDSAPLLQDRNAAETLHVSR